MFAKLSIRAKITAVLAFLLIATAGVGVLSVTSMRAINESAVDIRTNWLPSIRLLERLGFKCLGSREVTFRGEPCTESVYAMPRNDG